MLTVWSHHGPRWSSSKGSAEGRAQRGTELNHCWAFGYHLEKKRALLRTDALWLTLTARKRQNEQQYPTKIGCRLSIGEQLGMCVVQAGPQKRLNTCSWTPTYVSYWNKLHIRSSSRVGHSRKIFASGCTRLEQFKPVCLKPALP